MERKDFILKIVQGSAVVFGCSCFWGCGEDDNGITSPTPPSGVDFTLDLIETPNSSLQNTGGFLYRGGIIIANIGNNNFVAFQQACTHQGTTIQYEHTNSRFHCPNHGSNFSLNGSVINGPATRNLKQYTTELNGDSLRVFG